MNGPRIDFYILSGQGNEDRARLACRLADKAYRLGHSVYIATDSEAQAAALDDLLWTFRQDSFVPHERYPLTGPEGSPVLIGVASPAEAPAQVLINCTDALPEGLEGYERVAELVDAHPDRRAQARERFKHYRERGFSLETHAL